MTDTAADPAAASAPMLTPASPREWHARVWQLTWPVILANLTIPLVGLADVAVMGRLPDPAYIGAVAMGAAMFSAVYWMFGFLRMGTTGLTAQAYGRGQADDLIAIFCRALAMAAALGGAIVLLQWPLSTLLFALFDPGTQVGELAGTYYMIRVWGAPGLLIHLVELGMLFGLQRMRDTLLLSIGLNVSNLILDLVLVLGFDMGVAGVATGTVISEWGAAALGAWLVVRALRRAGWQGRWPDGLWQGAAMARLFHVSGNLMLRTFFVQLPFFIGTVIATGMGEVTLAAHGVLMQLFFVMTYSLDGFAHTAETLAGYYYGAANPAQLRRASLYCCLWALLLALATGGLFMTLGTSFIDFMTVSEAVRAQAGDYLPWVALAPLFCVWAFLFDGIFIGTTHIVEMRNAMFASAALWALVLWLTLPSGGYHAVWGAMNLFMAVRGGLLALYYPRLERGAGSPDG